jgi:trypsin
MLSDDFFIITGHTCGGTLIADDIILSAAHCRKAVDGADLGRHNVKDPDETYERYNIEKFVVHDKYVDPELSVGSRPGKALFDNDFMILKLYGWSKKKIVQLNKKAQTPTNKQELTVAGWGVSDYKNQISSEVLKDVTVNTVSNKECSQSSGYHGGTPVSFAGKITNNMICASDKDEDACQGDSGGPLIVKGTNAKLDVQVGVVSWGLGCAHHIFPGVYSRVSRQYDWIRDQVCELAESPPDSFDCQKATPPDNSNDQKRAVTVEIFLDRFPKETGWLIRSNTGKSIAYIPVGGYKGLETKKEKHIVAKVELAVEQKYDFIMLDSYGDVSSISIDIAIYSLTYSFRILLKFYLTGGSFFFPFQLGT